MLSLTRFMHMKDRNSTVTISFDKEATGGNSTYPKLTVRWLNEVSCYLTNALVAGGLLLKTYSDNRQFQTLQSESMRMTAIIIIDENIHSRKITW